jgi:hypothetical protein
MAGSQRWREIPTQLEIAEFPRPHPDYAGRQTDPTRGPLRRDRRVVAVVQRPL